MEQILDLWADLTDCQWTAIANDIILITPEENRTYHSMKEAVLDCLYTITELVKEI